VSPGQFDLFMPFVFVVETRKAEKSMGIENACVTTAHPIIMWQFSPTY